MLICDEIQTSKLQFSPSAGGGWLRAVRHSEHHRINSEITRRLSYFSVPLLIPAVDIITLFPTPEEAVTSRLSGVLNTHRLSGTDCHSPIHSCAGCVFVFLVEGRRTTIQSSPRGVKVHYNGRTSPSPLFLLVSAALRTSLAESLTLGGHVEEGLETVICCGHWVNK